MAKESIQRVKDRSQRSSSSRPPQKTIPPKGTTPPDPRRREKERLAREEAKRQRQLRKLRRKRLFLISFALSLFFVALYYGIVSALIHFRDDGSADALPIFVFTKGEREKDREFAPETVFYQGAEYLPVTVLEPYMAISQYGDYQTRSFLLCENGGYASFYLGSSLALINGQRVFLEHPSFLKDDLLYLPVDFYEYHMNCFDYTHASALAANVLTFDPGVTPAFTTVPDEGSLSVSVESLPQPPVVEGGTEGTPQVPSTTF